MCAHTACFYSHDVHAAKHHTLVASVHFADHLFALQRDTAVKGLQNLTEQNETLKHKVTSPCTLGCDLVMVLQIPVVIEVAVCADHTE